MERALQILPTAGNEFGIEANSPASEKRAMSSYKGLAFALALATFTGLASVFVGNMTYAPEMYGIKGMAPAAEAHANGQNYGVFDLNLNIRALRDEQLKRMTKTPDVILLGASHWQEMHKDLLPGKEIFNAHIHRDYWEDPLGMVELLVRHDRLPKELIISIRDNQFRPVAQRKDFLWEPGIQAYRAMTKRLGIETQPFLKTFPYQRTRELLSLDMLFENVTRWYKASERPGPSSQKQFEALDTLLPDGSIVWSKQHLAFFTAERTERESIAFAKAKAIDPPVIEKKGVVAFEALLTFLKEKDVKVYLIQPPYNPSFWDRMAGTPYAEGLVKFEAEMQRIATAHDLPVLGSFNPHKVGCTKEMYIDAEHSNEICLKKLMDQFAAASAKSGAN